MATYGNPAAADNPYSDGAMSAPMEQAPEEQKPQEGGETAILPKSILAGKEFKVGEEVVLKITAIHGEEIQVEYAHDEPSEGEPEPAQEAPAAPSGGGDGYQSMME